MAAFDIKPLPFSLEEKKGRKEVVHHSVKMYEEKKVSFLFFFLRQFQDLERKEINA